MVAYPDLPRSGIRRAREEAIPFGVGWLRAASGAFSAGATAPKRAKADALLKEIRKSCGCACAGNQRRF